MALTPRTKLVRKYARQLRRMFPAPHPVRVRVVPARLMRDENGDPLDGTCLLNEAETRFDIWISDAPGNDVAETLIHEWCHALTWAEWERTEKHGPQWGVVYAEMTSRLSGETA